MLEETQHENTTTSIENTVRKRRDFKLKIEDNTRSNKLTQENTSDFRFKEPVDMIMEGLSAHKVESEV